MKNIHSFVKFTSINESLKLARQLYSDKIDKDLFDKLTNIDPSPTKKYLPFICKSYITTDIINDIKNIISEYDRLVNKNITDKKDINVFKSFDELKSHVKSLETVKTKTETKKEARRGSEIILDNDDFFIVLPKTYKASLYYGANTKWCTARKKSLETWNDYYYTQLATLYYIIIKNTNNKFAVIIYPDKSTEVRDQEDNELIFDEFIKETKIDKNIFITRNIEERKKESLEKYEKIFSSEYYKGNLLITNLKIKSLGNLKEVDGDLNIQKASN